MIDIRTASLVDFLPESIAHDMEIVALSLAIDPELRAVGAAIVNAIIMPRIAEVPEAVLDAIAWGCRLNELQLWVDASGDALTVSAKRALLADVMDLRKRSGTKFALRRMIDMVGFQTAIVEWFEEGAAPYTYRIRITVDEIGVTLAQLLQIPEITRRFAPARCQLTEIGVEANATAPAMLYPVITIGRHSEIEFRP